MIRYALRCEHDHRFDSWFGSSADFDRLSKGGLLSCAVCGSPAVEKDVMAPSVARTAGAAPAPAADAGKHDHARPASGSLLGGYASAAEQALAALREKIKSISDNVGPAFAAEARRIHEGKSPARPIIGEATAADAKALVEDGIPVAPLPWSTRRTN